MRTTVQKPKTAHKTCFITNKLSAGQYFRQNHEIKSNLQMQPTRAAQKNQWMPLDKAEEVSGRQESCQNTIPESLRSGLEALSGIDLSHIRVHSNSEKPAQFNALAFAQGHNIYLAPGQEKHLAHEGWHLVQQSQGRVQQSTSIGSIKINTEQALEDEADQMGAKAMQIGRGLVPVSSPIATQPSSVSPAPKQLHRNLTAPLLPLTARRCLSPSVPMQLRPDRSKKAKKEKENEARSTEAAWFAVSLVEAPLSDASAMLDSVDNVELLYAILHVIDNLEPETSEERRQHRAALHIGLINRIETFERDQYAFENFIDMVKIIRKAPGRTISTKHQEQIESILDSVSPMMLKKMEKELLLWSHAGKPTKMRKLIELVTTRSRLSPDLESERGRFDLDVGDDITSNLQDQVVEMNDEIQSRIDEENARRKAQGLGEMALTGNEFNKCLKLLSSVKSRQQVHPDQEQATLNARIKYEHGIKERAKGLHKEATLTRYAQELRMENLVGPVTIVPVKGQENPRHVPAMTDIFDQYSNAGDGWYYFYVSIVSHHTVFVAVRSESGSKEYFLIQMPPTRIPGARTKGDLEAFFDGWQRHGAASKVWPVYAKPAA